MKYVIVTVIASAITIFALQNTTTTSVRFLVWSLEASSLAAVILISVAAGIVLVGPPLWIDRWRLRARVRTLEAAEHRRVTSSGPGSAAPPEA